MLRECMNTFTSTYHPYITSSSTYAHIFHIGHAHPLAIICAYESKTDTQITSQVLKVFEYTDAEIAAVERAQRALQRWREKKADAEMREEVMTGMKGTRELIAQERERVAQKAKVAARKEELELDKEKEKLQEGKSMGCVSVVEVVEEECTEGEIEERGGRRVRATKIERVKEAMGLYEVLSESKVKFRGGRESIVCLLGGSGLSVPKWVTEETLESM